ncbi:alpha/beta hydrolase [Amycolatopsis sp. GM8]|uniref:alpha/beta hydrolase n=1 Tax=Amycolatopsis sp. GM8 TaxID=2896530 RepID=UPI001F461099|nr:alpha/beta hydrolase [Amycolatopsis sp. GM8]
MAEHAVVSPALRKRRAAAEAFVELASEPEGVRWTEVNAGGITGLWAEAIDGSADRVVQYLHGGGYLSGSAASHRRLGGHLAKAVGGRVFLLDYGRAPENPHPGPVNDSVAAYRWLLDDGVRPDRLAVAGDSSGGGLALATLLKLRDDGLPQPAAAVALSPWTDLEVTGETVTSNADQDLIVTPGRLRELAEVFLAGGDVRDPLAAPLHGDYRGVCPIYLQVGGAEILLDDSNRVAEVARRAGVDVTVDVFAGMQHVFQMKVGKLPAADEAIARMGDWLSTRLGGN